MAATVSLSTLRERVLQKANMEHSEFVSEEELNQYINESWAELYEKLALQFSDRFIVQEEITLDGTTDGTISPTQLTNAPFGFMKFRGLDKMYGAEWIPIEPMDFKQRHQNTATSAEVRYMVGGYGLNSLAENDGYNEGYIVKLYPVENSAGQYRLWYIPYARELTETGVGNIFSSLTLPNYWHQYIVVDSAIKCIVKEEGDPAALLVEKASIIQRIQDMEREPDADRPKKIQDVSERDYIGWRRLF